MFEDASTKVLEAVSGDSDTDDDEEMEPVAAIPMHLADIRECGSTLVGIHHFFRQFFSEHSEVFTT